MEVKKIDLGISKQYVSSWSVEDAIRELTQNCIDGGDHKITYENDSLTLINHNKSLSMEALALGYSNKINDPKQIGQFGEGLKLAALVLTRENIVFSFFTGRYHWDFTIEQSETFGVETLHCSVTQDDSQSDIIEITIHHLSDYVDNLMMENLHIREAITGVDIPKISTTYGSILTDKTFAGRIYVEGLFIQEENDLDHGFDFDSSCVKLDRDRKAINYHELLNIASRVVTSTSNPELIFKYFKTSETKDKVVDLLSELPDETADKFIELYLEDRNLNSDVCFIDRTVYNFLQAEGYYDSSKYKLVEEEPLIEFMNEKLDKELEYDDLYIRAEDWDRIKNSLPSQLKAFNNSDLKDAYFLFNKLKQYLNEEECVKLRKLCIDRCSSWGFRDVLSYINTEAITEDDYEIDFEELEDEI